MLSTAVLVVVIGSVIAMLVAAENRHAEELEQQQRQPKHPRQPAAQCNTGSGDDESRYFECCGF